MVDRIFQWARAIEGPRDGHYHYEDLCQRAEYIESELKNKGFVVERNSFEFRKRTFWNIVATEKGFNSSNNWVLVGAHYDAVAGSPGADDNASGVVVLLEVAKTLGPRPGLVFVCFT
ncbi:MAG: M28 family peptidase, partial [Nitrospirae bacterium]